MPDITLPFAATYCFSGWKENLSKKAKKSKEKLRKPQKKKKKVEYLNFEYANFHICFQSRMYTYLSSMGETYVYKDMCSLTKQCAINRFECTLINIYVHSHQS